MSNRHTLQAAIDEENRRKDRALMSDTYNLDCGRMPPSEPYKDESLRAEAYRQAGMKLPPTYPVADDSGQRLRRSDKPAEKVSDPVNKPAPEYTGGSVSYYSVLVSKPTNPDVPPYIAECNDIIESLNLNYAEGNAFKAIWRMAAARMGKMKKGYADGLYDAEKVEFFGKRLVAQNKAAV